jgi:hypothetical protein
VVRLIRRWWRWLTARLKGPWWREVRYCEAADELPSPLGPRVLYLVGTAGHEKWAVFACPCGRDHAAWLNLQRSQRPRWRVGGRGLSRGLRPSVWFDAPWDCHFWIWRGRVLWVRDR